MWNEAEFVATDDKQIIFTIEGEGTDILPYDATNPIADAALQIYDKTGNACNGLRIHCVNRVPLSSGLGSSSAAMLTGMLGANALLGNPLSDEEILKLAIETEGHPDNVAPAMLGGLVASIVYDEHVISLKLPARANRSPIHVTVVLPDFDFPTKQARAILPKQVDRKDAIYNISRAVLVTEALRTGDLDLLGKAMSDALHQPYRIPLIPGAQAEPHRRRSRAAAVGRRGVGGVGRGDGVLAVGRLRQAVLKRGRSRGGWLGTDRIIIRSMTERSFKWSRSSVLAKHLPALALLVALWVSLLPPPPVHAETVPPEVQRYVWSGEQVVPIELPLIRNGVEYRVYYMTTSDYRPEGLNLFRDASATHVHLHLLYRSARHGQRQGRRG